MKFSDLFVPKYIHSDPAVRLKFIANSADVKLLEQMAVKDADEYVRVAAADRAQYLIGDAQTV